MTQQYEQRLIELVEELFKDSRYLLNSDITDSVILASDIAHLKGYVEILKEDLPASKR